MNANLLRRLNVIKNVFTVAHGGDGTYVNKWILVDAVDAPKRRRPTLPLHDKAALHQGRTPTGESDASLRGG
jgi:hypothetical protein